MFSDRKVCLEKSCSQKIEHFNGTRNSIAIHCVYYGRDVLYSEQAVRTATSIFSLVQHLNSSSAK